MKKNKLIPVVVAILVLGVGGYFLMSGKTGKSQKSGTSTADKKTVAEKFTGTLKEAVALGVGMKCTYKVQGNEYVGYVKGENYRGKMKSAEGKSGEVIMKDDCMWTWSEGEPQGMKICFEEVEGEDTEEGEGTASLWDQEEGSGPGTSYTCVPHAVTDAQFTPPSNIEFMDLEQMMQNFGY